MLYHHVMLCWNIIPTIFMQAFLERHALLTFGEERGINEGGTLHRIKGSTSLLSLYTAALPSIGASISSKLKRIVL